MKTQGDILRFMRSISYGDLADMDMIGLADFESICGHWFSIAKAERDRRWGDGASLKRLVSAR